MSIRVRVMVRVTVKGGVVRCKTRQNQAMQLTGQDRTKGHPEGKGQDKRQDKARDWSR